MLYIYKPSWLESWLSRLNWDILTWHIYIGDAIESGIDWALGKINNILEKAEEAYNWATITWDNLWSEASKLWRDINSLWDSLKQQAQDLWGNITQWWNERYPIFYDWVTERWRSFTDWVIDVKNTALTTWNTEIYPTLKSIDIPEAIGNFFKDKLGIDWPAIWQNIKDFFTSTIPKTAKELWDTFWDWAKELPFIGKEEAETIAEEKAEPGKEAKHWWDIFLEDVKLFFTNPIDFLLDKIDLIKILDDQTEAIKAVGYTTEARDKTYDKVPPVEDTITELKSTLKDEAKLQAEPEWGPIEEDIEKIKELAKRGLIG